MKLHRDLEINEIKKLIHRQSITLAGNVSLGIYGTLSCKSGKRMKKTNRVFFKNETEAIQQGFRPCGHCRHDQYVLWKLTRTKITSSLLKL